MGQPLPQKSGKTRNTSGANPGTLRGSAICAALGGLLLVPYAILMNLKPRGCIAEECVGQSYREAGPLEAAVGLAALGLLAAALIGLYLMHRFKGQGARIVRIAALTAVAALLIGVLGPAILGVFFQSDSSLLYFFVILPAVVLAMLAFMVLGAGLTRSQVLPTWSGVTLLLTSLLLFVFNDQNERVFLIIPFGMTWMVLGGLLWARAASPDRRWHARIQHV